MAARTLVHLVSCLLNTVTVNEGILDAQVPRNAKGDAKPSSSHFAAAVRQKTLAPKGLASFGAELLRRSGHRPFRYATAPPEPLCIQNRPIHGYRI